jgi:hypothetical protein
MNGVVTEISLSSLVQGGDVLYTVRIETEDVGPRPKWGMTVEVTFEAPKNEFSMRKLNLTLENQF